MTLRCALLSLLALSLAGCSGPAGRRSDDTAVVVSAIGGPAAFADPSAGPLDAPERALLGATMQGLVRFDAGGQIEPGLAERWIVIDDGRSYIFRLREAYWADGEPVTAAQVVRVLRRAAAPGSRNALAPFLAVIEEIVEMTPAVIEVRLKRPRPDLLKLFAQPELALFRSPAEIGSGPFTVVGARKGQGLLLQPAADPEVEPAVRVKPEQMVRLRGERAALAVARFRAGASDLVMGGTFADWPLLPVAGLSQQNIRLDPAIGLFGLAVARREGFLAEAANRAAVAMAIEPAAVTGAVLPEWTPADTLLPSQLDSAAPPARAPWAGQPMAERIATARARVLIWQRTGDTPEAPVRLRIALPAGPGATLVWGQVALALRRIGIVAERVAMDAPADLRLVDAVAPYDSGRWFLATACLACSPPVRALIDAARDAPDLAQRSQRIAEADAALAADAAFLPLAGPLRWSIVAMRLGAWQRNSRAWHPLNHVRNETE